MAREIELTRGMRTIVDDSEYVNLNSYKWYALQGKAGFYAARRNQTGLYPRIILMHRFLLDAEQGIEVDHINGNPLDNRRENLRLATKSQNAANTNRYDASGQPKTERGVWLYRNAWVAQIKSSGKNIYLGRFKEKREALEAYNAKAVELFGEFAKLNKLETSDVSAVDKPVTQ